MLHDAARIKKEPKEEDSSGDVMHKELKTKEDIKNHLKGLM